VTEEPRLISDPNLSRSVMMQRASITGNGRICTRMVKVKAADVFHALVERTHQGSVPSARPEGERILVELDIGLGKESKVGVRNCGELFDGNADFDLPGAVLFGNGEEVELGERFRGVALNEFPVWHWNFPYAGRCSPYYIASYPMLVRGSQFYSKIVGRQATIDVL